MHKEQGRPRTRVGIAGLGALGIGVVVFLTAMATYLKFRSAAPLIAIAAAMLAGCAAALLLRRSGSTFRWAVPAAIAVVVGLSTSLAISALPPTSDQLQIATRLVHDSRLRAARQIHDGGFVNDGQFCIPSCEVRAEQSDFDASADAAVRDIVERLESAGFRVTTRPGAGSFVDFEADPARTVVIRATRRNVDLLISVAPAEGVSVVASVAD